MMTLEELRRECEELSASLSQPQHLSRDTLEQRNRRRKELAALLDLAEHLEKLRRDIAEHEAQTVANDIAVRTIATEELPPLRAEERRRSRELQERMTPKDSRADGDALLEIRAGTGGDEAALFARDLFAMYRAFAERRGWHVRIASERRNDLSGYKEIIADVLGAGVYGALRDESGVHRVQRIPVTEKSGRVHTSTATVAVLPAARPGEVEIRPQDLTIDTFRASGHGGQNVQKTESAVRITHRPSGIVITCQDERSQHTNKERALAVLRSRLLAARLEAHARERQETRRQQIGTGDRAEKIRTYNFPQDRVTDHRLKNSWHGVDRVLHGDLDALIEALRARPAAER